MIPSPSDLNLNIPSWRTGQEEMISVTVTSEKRVTTICAPTGFGKSPAAVASALISKEPTCIVTHSKGLQDQYMRDFSHLGMVDLRGKRNYECGLKPDYTCEEGHVARCPYKGTVACPSSRAEMAAASSNLVVTNYAKWCASKKYGTGMTHFSRVIFDEGDQAFGALCEAMQVILSSREINEKLQIDFPDDIESLSEWKIWATGARALAEVEMLKAKTKIDGISDPKPFHVRHFTHMRNLSRRLAVIACARAADWIVEELKDGKGFQFDPIRPGRYVESALLFKIPKVVFISATIRPKTMFMIGIGQDSFQFKEFDSDFDPIRCPTYYLPTMRVDGRNPNRTMLWAMAERFMSRREDRSGIIQTTSYDYQKEAHYSLSHRSRMILNNQGEDISEAVDIFCQSPRGSILVSPSVGSGYNFPGQLCEWQFFIKLPFEPPSRILKAREEADPEYRAFRTINKFEQGCGRGMRSRDDRCENIIGDQHLDWFWNRYQHFASRSFRRRFQQVKFLPPPPERL